MGKLRVRAKDTSSNGLIVGYLSAEKKKIYAGDEFEISDEEIEVDEIENGQKTGRKIKKYKYFSDRWMEIVDSSARSVEVQRRPARSPRNKDAELI